MNGNPDHYRRFGWVNGVALMCAIGLIALSASTTQAAGVPDTLNYQGKLLDSAGTPENGSKNLTFNIYTASSGGSLLYAETVTLTVTNGIFNHIIGTGTVAGSSPNSALSQLAWDTSYYLEIKVDSDTLLPRQRLTPVGYAFNADTLDGIDSTGFLSSAVPDFFDFTQFKDAMTVDATTTINMDTNAADLNFDSNTFFVDSSADSVGIGTASPSGRLDIEGGDVFIGTGTLANTTSNEDLSVTGNLEVDGTIFGGTIDTSSFNFLSSNSSDTYESGTLTLDSDTILDVDGTAHFDHRVGIGDETPEAPLEIAGSATSGYLMVSDAAGGDGDVFIVDENKRVGIGTSSPTSQLDLIGSLRSTGPFEVGGTLATAVSYNIISDATTASQAAIDSDDDLYIEGSLQVDGTIFGGTLDPSGANFLSSNSSDTYESGTLTLDAGTVLDVDGSALFELPLGIGGIASQAYNAISDSGTASQSVIASDDDLFIEGNLEVNGTIFGGTFNAADADTLDGLDSTSFLRSDTSDSFTSGTLTLDAGTILDVDGSLSVGADSILDLTGSNLTVINGALASTFVDTIYTDAQAISAVEDEATLDLTGAVTVAGDLQVNGSQIGLATDTDLVTLALNTATVSGILAATTVTGANVTSGADPGHTHTMASVGSVDISDDTNLAVSAPVTLTDDTIGVDVTGDWTGTLDSIEGASLLRSDTSDSFTSGTLTLDAGTILDVDGTAHFDLAVGIGTATPGGRLSIVGAGTSSDETLLHLVGTFDRDASDDLGLIIDTDSESGDDPLKIRTDSTSGNIGDEDTRFIVTAGGTVGIGTVSPSSEAALHVTGTFNMDATDDHGIIIDTDSESGDFPLIIRTDSTLANIDDSDTKFLITNAGSVGIGTTSPGSQLDLSGSFRSTGPFEVGGTLATAVSYNIISDATTASQAVIDSDDDLFIEGNLQVAGSIFGGTLDPSGANFLSSNSSDTYESGTLTLDSDTILDVDGTAHFDNRVGIGTATPSEALHIVNSTTPELIIEAQDGSNTDLRLKSTAGEWLARLQQTTGNFQLLDIGGGSGLAPLIVEKDVPANMLYLDSTGNLGIGDTDPDAILEVAGSAAAGYFMVSDAVGGDGDVFVVDENQRVGIGTASPSVNLHVNSSSSAFLKLESAGNNASIQMTANSGREWVAGITDTNDAFSVTDVGDGVEFVVEADGSAIVAANLMAGGLTGVAYNALSDSGTPGESVINSDDDLYIEGNLEVDGTLFGDGSGLTGISATGVLAIGGVSAQAYSAISDSTTASSAIVASDDDLYVEGSLEIDGTAVFDSYVGIGTVSPVTRFHVVGDAATNVAMRVDNLDTSAGSQTRIPLAGTGTDAVTNGIARIDAGKDQQWTSTANTRDGYLVFNTRLDNAMTEKVRITSAGNVGIGDTDPDATLEVAGSAAAGYFMVSDAAGGDGNVFTVDENKRVGIGTATPSNSLHVSGATARITLTDTDTRAIFDLENDVATPAADTEMGRLNFSGNDDAGAAEVYARIAGWVTDDTAANPDGYLTFFTDEAGTLTEQLRIDNIGNVGIGDTDPDATLEIAGSAAAGYFMVSDAAGGDGNVFTVDENRRVGINTASPSATLEITSGAGVGASILVNEGLNSAPLIELASANMGNDIAGSSLKVGNNTNLGSAGPAPGTVNILDANGSNRFIWIETGTGDVRVHTLAPTGTETATVDDNVGTVIGTQTSWHKLKSNIVPVTKEERKAALEAILESKIFSYSMHDRDYIGFVIYDEDRGSWFSWNDKGPQSIPSLNERNLFGYLTLAIQELEAENKALKFRLSEFERRLKALERK